MCNMIFITLFQQRQYQQEKFYFILMLTLFRNCAKHEFAGSRMLNNEDFRPTRIKLKQNESCKHWIKESIKKVIALV